MLYVLYKDQIRYLYVMKNVSASTYLHTVDVD